TPKWSVRLPGGAYRGDDPDGFLPRDRIAAHLEDYAGAFSAPVREGVDATTVEADADAFTVRTTAGDLRARTVVAASGTFGRPHRPSAAASLPPDLPAIDVGAYRRPDALPPGRVLVVGSGQSGCQVAEELREAGRDVVLSCGRAPWVPRRVGERDVFWWLLESGFMGQTADQLPSPAARLIANPLTSGRGGGHDLHLRSLRGMGVTLVGRLMGIEGGVAVFAADLGESVAWGDARHAEFATLVRQTAARLGMPDPDIAHPTPFDPAAPERIPLATFGAVVFTGGFRPDYRSWLPWPAAFDDTGFPYQVDGASTVVDGLFFVGTHFLRTRASSILAGVGEDAVVVAREVAVRLGVSPA
ncbi:MAG TPA: NAD(P)-binding domain-containing protein, partial [Candidatus Limnocylindrales bacterium]